MKKTLQIAFYDFKRLALNPIALMVMLVLMIACMLTGLTYKIQPQELYSATTIGEYTKDVYNNFLSENNSDNKSKLDAIIEKAENYISIQTSEECFDFTDLEGINKKFQNILNEVEKFHRTGSCVYTENNDITTIQNAVNELSTFVENFGAKKEFESRLIMKNSQFDSISSISKTFNTITTSESSISEKLAELYENSADFDTLKSVTNDVFTWKIDAEKLNEIQNEYLVPAKAKLNAILAEIKVIYNNSTNYDTENLESLKSLITNYKFICESAKNSVNLELKFLLNEHSKKYYEFYGYEKFSLEDAKLELVEAKYYINDENLYYTQYQVPLNFNKASYKVTTFDFAYFITSIIGFIIIIFAIFSAYKLFGQDRKNGKVDLLLTQNVTFGQVFTGKFLAIVYSTTFYLGIFACISLILGALLYNLLPGSILAIFNLSTAYTISPFLFFLIKLIGIELQAIFYAVITIFLMNVSRKFDLYFAISLTIFAVATVCNIFLNGSLWYCLFPFIHADLTSFLGGATMQSGFLVTSLYSSGNFFISLVYYGVVVCLLFNLTKQLFKKN